MPITLDPHFTEASGSPFSGLRPMDSGRQSAQSAPAAWFGLAQAEAAYILELGITASDVRTRRPIPVQVEQSTDGFTVSDPFVWRRGDGETLGDAIDSYADALLVYFRTLHEHQPRLSPRMQRHLRMLQTLLEEV